MSLHLSRREEVGESPKDIVGTCRDQSAGPAALKVHVDSDSLPYKTMEDYYWKSSTTHSIASFRARLNLAGSRRHVQSTPCNLDLMNYCTDDEPFL